MSLRGLWWWLTGLRPEPTSQQPLEPPAEERLAEDYEEAAWDEAFREEMAPVMAAKNAKWAAFGRGEKVPGAPSIVRGQTPEGKPYEIVREATLEQMQARARELVAASEHETFGRYTGGAAHARKMLGLASATEGTETMTMLNDVNKYAPPGGKLLRSDTEADGIRHTFSTAEGTEVVCEVKPVLGVLNADTERAQLAAFQALHAERPADPEDDIPEG